MKKEIEELIPNAIEATQKFLMTEDSKVQKEYDGYAASLGAAIRTSGLIPALTFYTDVKRKDGDARRYKLLQAVAYCLDKKVDTQNDEHKRFLLREVIIDLYQGDVFNRQLTGRGRDERLPNINTVADFDKKKKCWTKKITHASIALKLAMRNFEHSENPKS